MEHRWLHAIDGTLSSGASDPAGKRRAAPPAQAAVVPEAAVIPWRAVLVQVRPRRRPAPRQGANKGLEEDSRGPLVRAVQQ